MVFLGFGDPGIADRRKEKMIFQNAGEITFKGKGYLAPECKIVNSGSITFGGGFDMKARSTIISDHEIKFGDHVLISWDCLFMDTDMHVIRDEKGRRINDTCPVCVGNDVWIGCRTTILKGANIADGDVIGAGSIIRHRLSNRNCVYINEAPVRGNIHWEK